MASYLVMITYGATIALALALLYFFHSHWIWHVLSICLAIAIGLTPIPSQYQGPRTDMMVGAAFLFLLFWGLGAIFIHHPPAVLHHRHGA
jgi:hypothetical protein